MYQRMDNANISPNFSEDKINKNELQNTLHIFLFQYKWVSTRDLDVKIYLIHACIAL